MTSFQEHWQHFRNFHTILWLNRSLRQKLFWSDRDLSLNTEPDSHAKFRGKLLKALTARPQKTKLSWILKQIFHDRCRPTYTQTLDRKHTGGEFVSFWQHKHVQYFYIKFDKYFILKACWLQFIILKKICGIKPGQDQVTWPDLLHRHTSTLERFQEWSVAWTWSRIWGWHWNRCRPRSSDLTSCDVIHMKSCLYWSKQLNSSSLLYIYLSIWIQTVAK